MNQASHFLLGLAAIVAVVAALPRPAAAGGGDAYDDAFARAAALEGEGRVDEAARALEDILPLYPQDYALPLEIAWMHRRAGRFSLAERFYRVAVERSPGAADARLGLASALEALGRCDEARSLFSRLAAERPDLAAAASPRCAPAPAFRITPSISFAGTLFPGHPEKALAGGVTGGVTLAHRSGFFLGGTYRYTRFSPATGASLAAWDQHEGYLTTGWAAPAGGFGLHYAVVADGSGALGTSHHVGLSGRWSPFGDIELRASASFYGDMKVLRVEPSWRIPVVFGLSVRPGVGLADAGGEFLATGLLTLSLDRRLFSLWAGGKYGDEVRPVYLSVPVIYDVVERIPYGAWAGMRVNVTNDAGIHISYAMDRLKQADGTATSAHTLALGAAVSF